MLLSSFLSGNLYSVSYTIDILAFADGRGDILKFLNNQIVVRVILSIYDLLGFEKNNKYNTSSRIVDFLYYCCSVIYCVLCWISTDPENFTTCIYTVVFAQLIFSLLQQHMQIVNQVHNEEVSPSDDLIIKYSISAYLLQILIITLLLSFTVILAFTFSNFELISKTIIMITFLLETTKFGVSRLNLIPKVKKVSSNQQFKFE